MAVREKQWPLIRPLRDIKNGSGELLAVMTAEEIREVASLHGVEARARRIARIASMYPLIDANGNVTATAITVEAVEAALAKVFPLE